MLANQRRREGPLDPDVVMCASDMCFGRVVTEVLSAAIARRFAAADVPVSFYKLKPMQEEVVQNLRLGMWMWYWRPKLIPLDKLASTLNSGHRI